MISPYKYFEVRGPRNHRSAKSSQEVTFELTPKSELAKRSKVGEIRTFRIEGLIRTKAVRSQGE